MELSDNFYGVNPSTHKHPLKFLRKEIYKEMANKSRATSTKHKGDGSHTFTQKKRKRSIYALNVVIILWIVLPSVIIQVIKN